MTVTPPDSPPSRSLQTFLGFLADAPDGAGLDPGAGEGVGLDAEAIADLLWLAVHPPALPLAQHRRSAPMPPPPSPRGKRLPAEDQRAADPVPAVGPKPPPSPPTSRFSSFKEPEPSPERLEAQILPKDSVPGSERLPVWVRDPFAFLNPHSLFKSVLPVMPEVAGDQPASLDEEATLDGYARWRQLIPVWHPEQHYRFVLTLIVDDGFSMTLWRPLIDDLLRRLRGFHGFQSVREVRWTSHADKGEGNVLFWKFGKALAGFDSPGRGAEDLVVVVSDCAGPKWWAKDGYGPGLAFRDLKLLGAACPVVIWQVLPNWMWSRTALGHGDAVALRRSSEGSAWPFQPARPLELPGGAEGEERVSVPVVELSLPGLRTWGQLIGGSPFASSSGILLPVLGPPLLEGSDSSSPVREEGDLAPDADKEDPILPLRRFQHLASSNAKQLMGLFAAAPVLTLPVMRLIQAALLETTSPSAMAEVLLSGLLHPIDREAAIDPETLQLTFAPPIRAALLKQQSPRRTLDVIEAVTDFIAAHWSQHGWGSFRAFLTDPAVAAPVWQADTSHFATLAADIIAQLGGAYTTFAERLRVAQRKEPWPRNLFRFQELEAESAVMIRSPVLEPMAFSTVNREREKAEIFSFETAGLDGKKLIKKAGHCRGYREPLGRVGGEGLGLNDSSLKVDYQSFLTMLHIPSGSFLMGSSADDSGGYAHEMPQHTVHLKEFFLSRTPVTQAQWRAVAAWQPSEEEDPWLLELDSDPVAQLNNPDRFHGDDRPVVNVSWHDAMEFCRRLRVRTGKSYGLPSEAQWEYACRAGTITPFHFGATLTTEVANYNGSFVFGEGSKGVYRKQTTDVATFPANAWGLYDMHGNVWEWCADDWHESYEGAPEDGRAWLEYSWKNNAPALKSSIMNQVSWLGLKGLPTERSKLLRGGSWSLNPGDCRSAYRDLNSPVDRYGLVG
ncbi:MAG: SAV_2336 N-terminal domain-related protein, partial [Cyanobacteriota bacterium]